MMEVQQYVSFGCNLRPLAPRWLDHISICLEYINMIKVEGLTKRYARTIAVDNISFEVEKGQIVGFLGPNGAGKTTTMRVLTASCHPPRGARRSPASMSSSSRWR
jgi:ABC-type polysaccharide/polyol phosphate transport system ATPase subunit